MSRRFSVEAVFRAVDRVTAPVNRIQSRMQRLTRSMTRGVTTLNRHVQRLSKSLRRTAVVAGAAFIGLAATMARVLSVGIEFEQTLVSASAKFGPNVRQGTEAFKALEDAARATGAATEFTASQSAEALNFLAMAGFTVANSIAALPGVVDLATTANMDLGRATDIASDALGAFGLATSDSVQLSKNLTRVNDVLAKATTSTNTNIEQLFNSMRDGGPNAASAGASIETFSAIAGTLANAGLKGSKAGNTLKNMFLSLQSATPRATKTMKDLGVSVEDASGDMRDILDIMQDLDNATKEMGGVERNAAFTRIFGRIPIGGVNILLAAGIDKVREFREELNAAAGTNEEMAAVIRNTVQGRLKTLNSAIEEVKISLFSLSKGPLTDVIEQTTEWVRANGELISQRLGSFLKTIFENLGSIAKWLKRIGIALAVFFVFSTLLKTFVLVMTAVNLAVAAAGLPFVLIALAVVALIAAIVILVRWWDVFVAKFKELPLGVQAAVLMIAGPIVALAGLAKALMQAWQPVKSFFSSLMSSISSIFEMEIGGMLGRILSLTQAAARLGGGAARLLGFGEQGSSAPSIVSPEERVANNLVEKRTTNSSEVTIKDETGRAELTRGLLGPALTLQRTGAF